jgi:hypothetical protein
LFSRNQRLAVGWWSMAGISWTERGPDGMEKCRHRPRLRLGHGACSARHWPRADFGRWAAAIASARKAGARPQDSWAILRARVWGRPAALRCWVAQRRAPEIARWATGHKALAGPKWIEEPVSVLLLFLEAF